jgi:hypothetical protein
MSRQALMRFETIADLYYRRFGRLAPGKSEPAALYRDSNDAENHEQYAKWMGTGQALTDAIDRIIDLETQSCSE